MCMAAGDTFGTNQHYVTQMLLRGFTTGVDTDQVWEFDKRTGRTFTTAVRVIAAERGYYDIRDSAVLDGAMNQADALTSPIINDIRRRNSVAAVSNDSLGLLAGFVVLQLLRTRGFQEQMRHMERTL